MEQKASPDFFVANETAGHSRGVTSALNALRTLMMAADSQKQNSKCVGMLRLYKIISQLNKAVSNNIQVLLVVS